MRWVCSKQSRTGVWWTGKHEARVRKVLDALRKEAAELTQKLESAADEKSRKKLAAALSAKEKEIEHTASKRARRELNADLRKTKKKSGLLLVTVVPDM